jgi:SAM-dependent methyltransferase
MTTKQWTAGELGDRIFESCNATFDVFAVHLGRKLGLYEAMNGSEVDSSALSNRTGTSERYVREWLEQQAVTGMVQVANPGAGPLERRYRLPAGYAEVLTDRDSLWYLGPAASMLAAAGIQLPALEEAFRSGGGVPWHAFGDDMRRSQAELNRPLFLQVLAKQWLASDGDVAALLSTAGARVADIGTGFGWSAIAIAEAYPEATVFGFDVDEPSVAAARENAALHGVADRVTFTVADPGADVEADAFDLVIACECLHDLPGPVAMLAAMRSMVRPGGAVLILDERTSDTFTPDAGDMERFLYGFSLTTCLPDGMSHQPSAATGTVMRRDTLERYSIAAGFSGVAEIPINHDQFRLYRLV